MAPLLDKIIGTRVAGVRVWSISLKIIAIFTLFLLVSNFTTNSINLLFNRASLLKMAKELLVKDLKEFYNFSENQFDLYSLEKDLPKAVSLLEKKAGRDLTKRYSMMAGVKPDGSLLFQSVHDGRLTGFDDEKALRHMESARASDTSEGFLTFEAEGRSYFGVYKYNANWNCFLLRAEEEGEFYRDSTIIFWKVTILILIITLLCTAVGVYLLSDILRFVRAITQSIMVMTKSQKMELIDLKGAVNDEITYLGMAFNSLSSSIDNLVDIFRRFVSRDVALRAYAERQISLDGEPKDLAILFSDIKGFTTMTEALGTDIIKLLNLHYDKAIHAIFQNDGIIGSIIGDAILAVYGAVNSPGQKSMQSIQSAYQIIEVARQLRLKMIERQEELVKHQGPLTPAQQLVFKAVLIEVGVGIDGGEVFYGNIGSNERMTNTVIGDNVNSAARLEGLTRVYKVPVICSEYIKKDIEKNCPDHGIRFLILDMVQVKGKTTGKLVYWPVLEKDLDDAQREQLPKFEEAIGLYLKGQWAKANKIFATLDLPPAPMFKERTLGKAPAKWNGIWEMKTK
ncbi:MAG: adenylate/guanylate cyclase domain-containing protein [Spirochaetes bacterium]|nr:adenylate/guanylate cyclase domain-containing protein [Spirochaetota bacterium]